jgi:hypothetical protein
MIGESMGELDNQIKRLYETTDRTRYEFLKNEVQACLIALEMAEFQLSIGNRAVAESEATEVAKGIGVLRRFLPATPAEQRPEIGKKLADIEAALISLKAKLNPKAR